MLELRTTSLQKTADLWASRARNRSRLEEGVALGIGRTSAAAKTLHPSWRDWTGNLRSSIFGETKTTTGRNISGRVFIDEDRAPYGIFQYLGTRGHGPVTAPFLVFQTRGGQWVKTKWVRGIKGDPWIFKAAEGRDGQFVPEVTRGIFKQLEYIFEGA